MNAMVHQDQLPGMPAPTSLLQVVERASRDPSVDVVKLKELIALARELRRDEAEEAFNDAMRECQKEMRPIAADAENPQTRSKYATYKALDKALRPIYTKHGFALSFDEGDSPKPDHIRVLCYVSRGAYTRTYRRDMPADGKGAKGGAVMTATHAAGAAGSYGSRYILKGIFNVAVGEDDRDGNTPGDTLTEDQVANLTALLTEVGANKESFLRWAKVKDLSEILAKNYQACVKAIEAKRR